MCRSRLVYVSFNAHLCFLRRSLSLRALTRVFFESGTSSLKWEPVFHFKLGGNRCKLVRDASLACWICNGLNAFSFLLLIREFRFASFALFVLGKELNSPSSPPKFNEAKWRERTRHIRALPAWFQTPSLLSFSPHPARMSAIVGNKARALLLFTRSQSSPDIHFKPPARGIDWLSIGFLIQAKMSSGKRRNPLGLSLPPTVNEDGTTGDKVGGYLFI